MNTNFPTPRTTQLLSHFNALLSANAVGGGFCLALLFALAFACVHLFKCIKIGWKHRHETDGKPQQNKGQKEKTPAPPQEPVYYVVERNCTRAKPPYGTHNPRFK